MRESEEMRSGRTTILAIDQPQPAIPNLRNKAALLITTQECPGWNHLIDNIRAVGMALKKAKGNSKAAF